MDDVSALISQRAINGTRNHKQRYCTVHHAAYTVVHTYTVRPVYTRLYSGMIPGIILSECLPGLGFMFMFYVLSYNSSTVLYVLY
jgi:hypothetical protein